MQLTNRAYDIIKIIVTVVIPILSLIYGLIATINDIPNTDAVLSTFAGVESILGGLIGISSYNYNRKE